MIAAVTPRALGIVAAAAPDGVTVRALPEGRDEAEFLMPDWDDAETLAALPRLERVRVVQSLSAGTDGIEPHVPSWAVLCNARGARDTPMAEWIVGALLGDAYGQLEAARVRQWEYEHPRELRGSTIVIVGFGSIGRALARRLEPFGVELVPVVRHARENLHGVEELPDLLGSADAVVLLTPLSPESAGLFDAAMLGRMRDGALLVNAGRGPVVDTDALVAELRSGRLRAVLDVVDPEPLPAGHPLWDLALAVTPHNAGDSDAAEERAWRFGAEQLGRFARGEPLENVVPGVGSG